MSWKEDFIAKKGEEAYAKMLERRKLWGESYPGGEKQRSQDRRDNNPEKARENDKAWRDRNPEKIIEKGRQVSRKDGKYYKKKLRYKQTGISGERERIRMRHNYKYQAIKKTKAIECELHHEWVVGTAKYRGVAFVEKEAHRHGVIKVIELLEGAITLFGKEKK